MRGNTLALRSGLHVRAPVVCRSTRRHWREPELELGFHGNAEASEYQPPSCCRLEQVAAYRHEGALLHHRLVFRLVSIVARILAVLLVLVLVRVLALNAD